MVHRPRPASRIAFTAAFACSTIVATTAATTLASATVAVADAPADGSATDQVIVTVASPDLRLSNSEISEAAGSGAEEERTFGQRAQIVKLPTAMSGDELEAVMQSLAEQPGVTAVEPDQILQIESNDTNFAQQWNLAGVSTSPIGINLDAAWAVTTGSASVKVAVIDGGFVDHADLNGRILGGYDFISDSQIANDGNGRDGDAHDPGDWVVASETTAGSIFDGCTVTNSSWHGSHVAGTIGAATNNGTGIAGINPTSPIVPVRALGKCGGYSSDILDGMRWAAGIPVAGVPTNPNPARVLSLSLGGPGTCNTAWQTTLGALNAIGVVVVVAAGNSNSDAANYSPAGCGGVVTVAATGKAGNRSYYSNYGATVELAAPGGDRVADGGDTILSTINSGTTSPVPGGDIYGRYQGTSMAAPHVTGVVSLMLSANPNLTPAQVTQILRQTATRFPTGSTCSSVCGSGIVNAGAAVAAAQALVTPPTTTTTTTTTTTAPTTTTTTTTVPATTTTTTTVPRTTTTTTVPLTTTTTTTTTVPRTTTTTTVPRTTTTTTVPRTTTTTTIPRTTTTTVAPTTTTTSTTLPVPKPQGPEAIDKKTPSNGATGTARKVRLTWTKASHATSYEVCLDSKINGACDGKWHRTRRSSISTGKLSRRTSYEWQVRAVNSLGSTNADKGTWFTFTTG